MPTQQKPPPPPAARRGSPGDRIVVSAALGLVIFALGLVPFYLLTPVNAAVRAVLTKPAPAVVGRNPPQPTITPSPSLSERVKGVGASTAPIQGATPAPQQTPIPLPTVTAGDPRFAFLLLGYGGGGHDGAYLTDSMMVVVVDPSQKTLTLLSLPRDSWVPLSFDGKSQDYQKINTAYAFAEDPSLYPDRLSRYTGGNGPGLFASDTVANLVGIPMTYYLALDFQGFREAIDAVGGIDVNVPVGFRAQYPANDDPSIDSSWKIIEFQAGPQHMNGERAIEYARARETLDDSGEGTDFARSRRQRLIIEAFKDRVFQPAGLAHLPQLLSIASKHVDTNYAVPALTGLTQLIFDWKSVRFYQTALTTQNYLEEATGPEGTYALVPNEPDHSWSQIRAFTRQLWKDPAVGVAMADTEIDVENDSGSPGLATTVSDKLIHLGYRVGDPVEGSVRTQTTIVDESGGTAAPLVQHLFGDLGITGSVTASATTAPTSTLLLQLGTDAKNLSLDVPDDSSAPSSTVGILKFGGWSPDLGAPATPTAPATPDTSANDTSLPTPTEAPKPTEVRAPARATPVVVNSDPNVVIVPNMVGLSESDAQSLINDSGLMTTYVNYQTASQVPDQKFFYSIPVGAVLSQNPQPGTKVPRGTRVALAIRKQ
jgi:LCP family protein required for cell wall assembly